MNGWTRLGILVSLLWISFLLLFAGYEYRALSRGDKASIGLIGLRDARTHRAFGRLSKSEIKKYGELMLEKSRRQAIAEPGDAQEAQTFLSASPQPSFRYPTIALWTLVPIAAFWALFLGIEWVWAGFLRRGNPLAVLPVGRLGLLGLVTAVGIFLFYWYDYRPTHIRSTCEASATKDAASTMKTRAKMDAQYREAAANGFFLVADKERFYKDCLRQHGLEP